MPLRPGTFAMTALLAVLISLGPLSTDMYLPSLPEIGRLLGATTAEVQLTLSAFLAGFAIGQILYGPISDKYGRKPVLLAALGLYILGSAACAAAQSIDLLIVARFFQAVGGSGPIVIARAIVRDLYEGPRAARELSLMGMIMSIVPAGAPILGGVLHVAFGWRSNFYAVLVYGLVALALVVAVLPETLRQRSTAPISPLGMARTFRSIAADPGFLANAAMFAAAYSGLFAFISASSFILQGLYGFSPVAAGAGFSSCVLGFLAGSLVGARLPARRGAGFTLMLGVAMLNAAGLGLIAALAIGGLGAAGLLVPMSVYTFGVGLTMPQTLAGAMKPFPDKAGAASSLAGFTQMTAAAATGIAVGHALGASAWPLAIAVAATALFAGAVFLASRGVRGRLT